MAKGIDALPVGLQVLAIMSSHLYLFGNTLNGVATWPRNDTICGVGIEIGRESSFLPQSNEDTMIPTLQT